MFAAIVRENVRFFCYELSHACITDVMTRTAVLLMMIVSLIGCTESHFVDSSRDDGGLTDAGSDGAMDASSDSDIAIRCGELPIEAEVRALVNQERREIGIAPLRCTDTMTLVARAHADDMCAQGYFDDVGLDGRNVGERMRDARVPYGLVDENISEGQPTPEAVVADWMARDEFRRTILAASLVRTGLGYNECGGRNLWVQVFAD